MAIRSRRSNRARDCSRIEIPIDSINFLTRGFAPEAFAFPNARVARVIAPLLSRPIPQIVLREWPINVRVSRTPEIARFRSKEGEKVPATPKGYDPLSNPRYGLTISRR